MISFTDIFILSCLFFFFYLAGSDLPDDDYTTIVPAMKQPNGTNRKLPNIPSIVENKENETPLRKGLFEEFFQRQDFYLEDL